MNDPTKPRLASLLQEIATEQEFDEKKYFEFSKLLGGGQQDDVRGRAWNELTELYTTWKHTGAKLRNNPDLNKSLTGQSRKKLLSLASEIEEQENIRRC